MPEAIDFIAAKLNYWVYVVLMMVGLYAMIAKHNLVKKVIGLNILQTAIILFFISTGAKHAATIPIIEDGHGPGFQVAQAVQYTNPLPHVLMLTAIVVAVATFGVALALIVRIHRRYHTLEEDEILAQLDDD